MRGAAAMAATSPLSGGGLAQGRGARISPRLVLRDNAGMSLAWRSLLVLFTITACGTGATSSEGDASSDAGSTTPGTADGSTTMVGATSMVATAMASSDATEGSDGVPGCPAFDDEASPGSITIEITNMRAEAVWLPMSADCIDPVPYVLMGRDGAEAPWRAPGCGTCAGAVQGNCPCPPPFCDEVTALYLEAGATVRYDWSGLVHLEEMVPEACPGIADCGATCRRAVVAPAGDYTFTIQAGGASGCAVEPCACTPMDGSCTLLDPGMMFTGLGSVDGVLALPGGTSVQIAIE
jgi:hypothetical protein